VGVDLALALNTVGDKLSVVGLYTLSAALLEEGVAVSTEPTCCGPITATPEYSEHACHLRTLPHCSSARQYALSAPIGFRVNLHTPTHTHTPR
jgi:hypothetical protein